jgi:predicted small secreted protein
MGLDGSVPSVTDPLIHDLIGLSSLFAEYFERPPTSEEFIQILAEGIRWSRDELVCDINGINLESLQLHLTPNARRAQKQVPAVSMAELPDAVLVASCNTVSGASSRIKGATRDLPTVAELCQALAAGIAACPETLLDDILPSYVQSVAARIKKRGRVVLRPGDIVAIPVESKPGMFYLACVVAKNSFGTAYGFFKGVFPPTAAAHLGRFPIHPYPIYSGEQCIASGQWLVVGRYEDLLERFTSEPEIFHRPSPEAPYGLAETASEKIRALTKEEADTVGLLDGTYRQTYTCEFLQTRLSRILNIS